MKKKIMGLRIACAALAVIAIAASICAVQARIELNGLRAERLGAVDEIAYSPEEAAAEFDGGSVSVAEAAAEYQTLLPYYQMLGLDDAQSIADAKLDVLKSLTEEKILEAKAKELGVYELDDAARAELEAQVKAQYEEQVQYYMAFRFDESKTEAQLREEVIAYLDENGSSYEQMLRQAEKDGWRDRLYARVTEDFTIDDAQLRAFYEEQLASDEMIYSANFAEYEADCDAGRTVLWHPEGVRRVQMLVVPFDDAQAAEYADVQALLAAGNSEKLSELDGLYQALEPQAQQLLEALRSGGDFGALFEQWGYGSADGEYMAAQSSAFGEEVRDAAMALAEIGDVSSVLRCDAGLCILRYAGDVPGGAVAYEQVRDALRASYGEELKQSHYNSTVAQWVSDANAKYYPEKF